MDSHVKSHPRDLGTTTNEGIKLQLAFIELNLNAGTIADNDASSWYHSLSESVELVKERSRHGIKASQGEVSDGR